MRPCVLCIAAPFLLSACVPAVAPAVRDTDGPNRPVAPAPVIDTNRPPGVYDLVAPGPDGNPRPYVLVIRDKPLEPPTKGAP